MRPLFLMFDNDTESFTQVRRAMKVMMITMIKVVIMLEILIMRNMMMMITLTTTTFTDGFSNI